MLLLVVLCRKKKKKEHHHKIKTKEYQRSEVLSQHFNLIPIKLFQMKMLKKKRKVCDEGEGR